jgi:hypothetical protein
MKPKNYMQSLAKYGNELYDKIENILNNISMVINKIKMRVIKLYVKINGSLKFSTNIKGGSNIKNSLIKEIFTLQPK